MSGEKDPAARRATFAGVFFLTLATLMYEILLTRIFSVTMWYHFAFFAISVAMFGLTLGGILVHRFPDRFPSGRTERLLAAATFWLAVTTIFSFLTHLVIPFVNAPSLVARYSFFLTFLVLSVPFTFSGIATSLALTRFRSQVPRLYAADLAGASSGCLMVVLALELTDGPTAVLVASLLAGCGALCFAVAGGSRRMAGLASAFCILLAAFIALNAAFIHRQAPLLRLLWVKGQIEGRGLYEKWNSVSRIRVSGDPDVATPAFGWGLSPLWPPERSLKQLSLQIDAGAGTLITRFGGNPDDLAFLRYDIVNLAHYLRPDADVLAVGVGGGRDVLAALAFGQRSVVGVEVNADILSAVTGRFGDFAGHLEKDPRVTLVHDEARSWIARSARKFDIIQVSFIDTWAATAAGAFVFSENSLYTVEAWKILLDHLSPRGVLTFSRWYDRDRPNEIYRLTSLARRALQEIGVEDPRPHLYIARRMMPRGATFAPDGVGTLILSREPLAGGDVDLLDRAVNDLRFETVISPAAAADPALARIASREDLDRVVAGFPVNIAPPTDDIPFFFQMLRLRDVFDPAMRREWEQSANFFNMRAVNVLVTLLLVVTGLSVLCIILPLGLTTRRETLRGSLPYFALFSGIGMGFMLIEISQMQRLIVFLGHPGYALSVVLVVLLASSGAGSLLSERLRSSRSTREPAAVLAILVAALALIGAATPRVTHAFEGSATPIRIAVASILLALPGLLMGMPFPMGMRLALARFPDLAAWLWGINGAFSVCASVLAVAAALAFGISAVFWTGTACYGIALIFCLAGARAST